MTAPARGPLSASEAPRRPVTPTPAGRREPWTPERIQSVIHQEMQDARNYSDEHLAPMRAEALRYYLGDEEIVPTQEGRSKVVSMDLRDTVLAVLPSLVRIFVGGERWAEFLPVKQDDEEAAKQRMDYVNHVAFVDNPGFRTFYTWFKEALSLSYSPLKWWWDQRTEVVNEEYTGQLSSQVESLAAAEDVTDVQYEEDGEALLPEDAITNPADVLGTARDELGADRVRVKTYTVRVRREHQVNKVRFEVIPGEEFFTNRDATTLEDARIVSHLRYITRSDLVALGYSEEYIDDHEGADFIFETNEEFLVRNPHRVIRGVTNEANSDVATVLYGEHLIRFDEDGDGIAEQHKVCTIGGDFFPARVEDASINFTILSPDLEPFRLHGSGFFQALKDVARVKTAILRATNDSLRQAIDPATVFNEELVNAEDIANQELGRAIRTTGDVNATVKVLETPFSGQAGLLMLEYWDAVKEQRGGGVTTVSQGLDADHLQSTSKMAIAAQLSAAQQRIEMVARVFAETGVKDLFLGIQQLTMQHQDVTRTVRLRGKWVDVDPRTWEAPMDMVVNVGLGAGLPEERIARLMAIKETQEGYLQTIGPSPMVDFNKLRYTNAKIVELAGWPDPSLFFGELPPGWAPEPTPPPPDPAVQVAQIQQQIEGEKRALEEKKALLDAETARLKIEADFNLKLVELQSKAVTDEEANRIQLVIESARLAVQREKIQVDKEKADAQPAA